MKFGLITDKKIDAINWKALDQNDNDIDFIGTLDPGKTIILSPPQGNSFQYVIVTADGDVHIFKAYREPVAMPGMMGS